MKRLLENLIRRRSPFFQFDPALDGRTIAHLFMFQLWGRCRGIRLLWSLRSPQGIVLGRGVRFFRLSHIRWGRFVRVGDQVFFSGLGRVGIRMGDNVKIGAFSRLVVSATPDRIGEFIRIGNNVGIGEFAYLGGAGGLTIGDDCIIGQYLSCHPENHVFEDTETPVRLQGVKRVGIVVGKNCWIGAKVTILDGVCIGEDCVIAAGAVVTRSIPAGSIAGGIPARLIGRRNPETSNPAVL